MKKQRTVRKQRLEFSRETLRDLNVSQLEEVAGGTNNGCNTGFTTVVQSACRICEF